MHDTPLITDRFNRIQRAVNFEKQDRTPVVLEYSGFAAHITQTPMAQFIGSPAKATDIMIQACKMIGPADAINYGSFYPYGLCDLFGAKVKVPGYDLPDNDMWQVVETQVMNIEDYDAILDIGWEPFFNLFMAQRILNDADIGLINAGKKKINVKNQWATIDVPVLSGGDITSPFDLLCGARSLENFFRNLY